MPSLRITYRHLHEVMPRDMRREVVRFELHAAALDRVTVGHLNHRHHGVTPGSDAKCQQPCRFFCTKFAPAGVVVVIIIAEDTRNGTRYVVTDKHRIVTKHYTESAILALLSRVWKGDRASIKILLHTTTAAGTRAHFGIPRTAVQTKSKH